MKKILIAIMSVLGIFGTYSCSDMLDTDSTRQVFDPDINQKTDSVSYAMGIMKGMQAVADQYFFQGEMRGELVTTTEYTNNNLRQLANFTAGTDNKYDSAYVYYNVINNCNYFLAHRDTVNLYTGDKNTTISEYVSIAALRAWAYMQLARTYKKVPFFTEPLTEISKVENNDYPEYDINQIVNALAPQLESYARNYSEDYLQAPAYGYSKGTLTMGKTNFGSTKYINPEHLFFPLRIALGEMYLEVGEYQKAAENYFKYLNYSTERKLASLKSSRSEMTDPRWTADIPSDYDSRSVTAYYNQYRSKANPSSWLNIFNGGANATDVISYIPMAVNKLEGTTTNIPLAFGYDYYASTTAKSVPTTDEIQITPSDEYYAMADTGRYYYRAYSASGTALDEYKYYAPGDERLGLLDYNDKDDQTKVWIPKASNATVYLYRNTTLHLHLAEAINRMGYPDAAFAILKDGISDGLIDIIDTISPSRIAAGKENSYYISLPSINMLRTTIPFLSDANIANYPANEACGIHQHGGGLAIGVHTLYQYKTVVGEKITELNNKFNLNITTPTKQDTINAVEDLLCDEAAMELAFEGCRFYDLCRFARHKNADALYGSKFGTEWMAEKYLDADRKAAVRNENWYLPFK